jgi:hypothetical protein
VREPAHLEAERLLQADDVGVKPLDLGGDGPPAKRPGVHPVERVANVE